MVKMTIVSKSGSGWHMFGTFKDGESLIDRHCEADILSDHHHAE